MSEKLKHQVRLYFHYFNYVNVTERFSYVDFVLSFMYAHYN
jgi:hypothetical protein